MRCCSGLLIDSVYRPVALIGEGEGREENAVDKGHLHLHTEKHTRTRTKVKGRGGEVAALIEPKAKLFLAAGAYTVDCERCRSRSTVGSRAYSAPRPRSTGWG